ncbi:hypothetical protein Tco_0381016 [Tanacetum coccineum]
MNQQETQQVIARDEKWVSSADAVKISSTNLRLETTVPQNEETFQVFIDVIKNSMCFKAFTISADVLEIFMQQFWYTIKKVQGTYSYEFLLANKKCRVDAEVFRKIMDICLRVEGEEFTELQNDDDTLTFLIDLGYKGPLQEYTNMYVDHMSQPWRTLTAIINKCLSGKSTSNDRLKKSRIDIMWGMFYRENVDYPELIWEDFSYQIDHRRERKSRREDYQEYGLAIPDIPPKKSRGKGSQGKKTVEDSQETIDVSEESEPELEHVKKKTASRRVVKKKVTISVDDNIIPDPDVSLELELCKHLKKQEDLARAPGYGGSSEGTGTISGVPDESTLIYATLNEGTEKDQLNDEEKDDKEGDADDEGDDHISDTQDTDDEDAETESDEDEIYKYKIHVRKDEDVEMTNVEVEDSEKGDTEISDVAQADVEKTEEIKDAAKKAKLPPTSSSLSVSSGFGDQFLKLSSDHSLVSTVKDNTNAEINSLMEVKIQFEVPHIQSLSILRVLVSTKRSRKNEPKSSKKPSTTKETPKDKAPSKGSKTGKSASTKEPVEEPIAEVVMDDVSEDVVRDDDQPQDTSEPKTAKTPNLKWFTQPLRPPTPDPEWKKHQVVLGQHEQPWFKETVSAIKDPLTFNDLMATPIDFSKYVLNRLKIDNLTQDILLGPAYNLLKGTCHPGHLTIVADYFFNNDLKYLKSSYQERKYTISITKTKAARYDIVGIKDVVPTLWSPTKVGYDKDALKRIKHWGERQEIVVKRADRKLYKFKEGDFIDLHLNDIEDMPLLLFNTSYSILTTLIFSTQARVMIYHMRLSSGMSVSMEMTNRITYPNTTANYTLKGGLLNVVVQPDHWPVISYAVLWSITWFFNLGISWHSHKGELNYLDMCARFIILSLFSLLKRLKVDSMIRVNQISQVAYRRACLMLALEGFSSSL